MTTHDQGSVPAAVRKQMSAAAESCAYCGHPFVGRQHERAIDRMIPGRPYSDHNNLVVSCFDCNMRKGSRSYSEWVAMLPRADAKRTAMLYRSRYGALPPPVPFRQITFFPRTTGYIPEEDDE